MAKTALGYRAEVVGSLLRPEYLKEAFDRFDRDEIGEDELVATQDRAALEAIALQEACGVDVITDGEVRRKFWFDPLTASLSGYNPEVPAPVPFTRGTDEPSGPPPMLPAVTDTLGMRQNLPLREYSFLSQHAHTPVKTTIAGMTYASVLWVPGYSDTVYPDRDEYMAEALRLMQQVVREVVDAGTQLRPARLPPLHPHGERGGPGEPPAGRAGHVHLARPDDRDGQRADPSSSPTSRSRCTCAAGTTGACGPWKADTTRSRSSSSTTWPSIGSSPSTTRRARVRSRRCGSSPRTRPSSSG